MGVFVIRHVGLALALRRAGRWVVGALACAGLAGGLLAALQFTQLPWKAYSFLAGDGAVQGRESGWEPTHILVMGGSGVPGESGLIRLWYAADAAAKHPGAPVWMALPCAEGDRGDPAAAAYAGELRLRGVEDVRCEPRACGANTREQALALVRALDAGGAAAAAAAEGQDAPRVLLVTSPEHVRRACLAVRRAARDAGRAIEVHGLAAENLSLDDHIAASDASAAMARTDGEAAPDGGSGGAPAAFRYDFWNNAEYTLRSAREAVALLYYRARGWI